MALIVPRPPLQGDLSSSCTLLLWEQSGKKFATAFLNDWIRRAKATGIHMLQQMPKTHETPRAGMLA